MYKVKFADTEFIYNDEQLRNFINIAVIHNRDINHFTVDEIK
jgi:hypothetical protein